MTGGEHGQEYVGSWLVVISILGLVVGIAPAAMVAAERASFVPIVVLVAVAAVLYIVGSGLSG